MQFAVLLCFGKNLDMAEAALCFHMEDLNVEEQMVLKWI
jgi:hypothetical protein